MALVLIDRTQQSGTANTTVSFTLSGAVTGFQSFAGIGNGNTTYYAATDVSGNWEAGIGTYATGGTLTRTTILSSSNAGAAVTFSGTVNVFVTYPSEKAVWIDASGNTSALGTIASGTWQGTTVGTAYGGTGVTSSSGVNSVVLRDASANININNYIANALITTAAAGTTILTVASARNQILVGATTQIFQLPNATTLALGQSFIFVNNSSGVLTVKDNASTTVETVPSGGVTQLGAVSIATSAGSWGAYSFIPAAVDWGTNALNLASTVISGGTWNGGTIATGYGGTGLTTFTTANNAIYSTGASTLAAGTLPVAAGGTGVTTSTGTGSVVLNTSPTFATSILGDFSNATVASRTLFKTSTTNASTGIYAVPNGTSTAASWQASNSADPTNASKILIATNGSTDVQLVSGINGTGTYLPLSFYTNGAEQMRLDTSGNLLVGTSSASTPSTTGYISTANTFGFKNRIINGAMVIYQRNQTLTTNNSPGYFIDRMWGFSSSTAATYNQGSSSGLAGFPYFARAQRTAGNTGTNGVYMGQIIESNNIQDLQGQSVTLSFWARAGANYSPAGSNLTVFLRTGTVADQGLNQLIAGWTGAVDQTSNVTLTTSWQYFSKTFTVTSNAQEITAFFQAPTTGTAGANDYFDITGFQLEKGTTATSFDYRPYGTELSLCQRYYIGSQVYNGVKTASGYTRINVPLSATMRTTPALVYSDSVGNVSKISTYASNDTRTNNRTPIVVVGSSPSMIQIFPNNTDADTGYEVFISCSSEL